MPLKAFLFALTIISQPVWAQTTVPSLDRVPGQLETPEAKSFWELQMEGKPAADGLGVRLPPLLPAKTLIDFLVPAGDHAAPSLVGAKPWPLQAGRYVAVVCTGGGAFDPDDPVCHQSSDETAEPLHVYLGVIDMPAGSPPRLVARTGPIAGTVDWTISDLPAPDDGDGERFERFDLAPYRVAPGQPAFGVRVGWAAGYAGGFANNTALLLFVVDGSLLRQVLAVPMSAFSNLAGDWHPDGTRDHIVSDASNILVVSQHMTAGHFDLLVKARNWDPVKRAAFALVGVGIEYGMDAGLIKILSAVAGSPAAEAGLKSGDLIIRIENHPVLGMAQSAIEKEMTGLNGGKVRLTIERPHEKPFDTTLTRTLITLEPSPNLEFRWSEATNAYVASACRRPCI